LAVKTDIRIRRSAVQGAIPATSALALGELAINTHDGKLFLKKDVDGTESIVEIGAPPPAANNATITIAAGTDLTTGGDFTTDQASNETITIDHAAITNTPSSASSTLTHEGTFDAITGLTVSTQGHITGVETTTFTMPAGAVPNNATITLSAGTYISGGGDFTTDQAGNETLTFNHDNTTRTNNTSTASPSYGGSFTAIDSITTNATGHVTAVNTKTVTFPASDNTDTTYTAGKGLTLNGTTFDANVSGTTQTVGANSVSSAGSRTYAIQVDASDNLVVNVPWTDTDTNTNTTYALTATQSGSPLNNSDPNITLTGSDSSIDNIQLVGAGATTITRNSNGQITISSTDTNTSTAYTAGTGLTLAGTVFNANVSSTQQSVAPSSVSAISGRTYAIQVDASDNLVVNVPWVDTNSTYIAGKGLTLTGNTFDANVHATTQTIAANSVSATGSRTYAVQVDASDNLVVNVPWTDTDTNTNTTYTLTAAQTGSPLNNTDPAITLTGSDASTDTIQLVGTGATTITRNSDGQITISSTDTNTNTTYTAGTGLTLNGTVFDANVNATVQTTAASAVTTDSGRTYAIQVDASDNLVVNVPWVDTNLEITESTTRLFRTSNTQSDNPTWQKLGRVTIQAQYQDYNVIISGHTNAEGSTDLFAHTMTFSVKQQAPFGSDPLIFLRKYTYANSSNCNYAYILVQNTPTTIVDLYIKTNSTFTVYDGHRLSESNQGRMVWESTYTKLLTEPSNIVYGADYDFYSQENFTDNSANWDTAFGWGDHSTENYAVTTGDTFTGTVNFNAGINVNSTNYSITDTGSQGFAYKPVEGGSSTVRYFLRFDYTDDASFPYLTNRTASGKFGIYSGGTAAGSEISRMTFQGGDGTQDIDITNADLDLNSNNIKSVGLLGVNIASPTKQITVYQNDTTTDLAGKSLAGGGTGNGVLIYNADTTAIGTYANLDFRSGTADGRIAFVRTSASDNIGDFVFVSDNGGTTPDEKLRLSHTGVLTVADLTLTGLADNATEATALVIDSSNVVGTRELGTNAFSSTSYIPDTGTFTLNGTANEITVTGTATQNLKDNPEYTLSLPDSIILADGSSIAVTTIKTADGQDLTLAAGESANYITGLVNEHVYVVAENGLHITSSPDNWDAANGGVNAWNNRNTAVVINDSDGMSTFNDVTVSGNLTINGTTVTNSATNTTIEDALIELGSGNTGANTNDLGLILERGTTGDNVFIGWDESADKVRIATTTNTGADSGGLTLADADFQAGNISARTIFLQNLEKTNLATDGQLGFDSSQGLLIYRTQQGTTGAATTVLDGWNVAAGTYIGITNLGAGGTGTEEFTFSHNNTTRSDATSTASPAHGGTFTVVDSVTTNATGHVTAINVKTVTLPADNNTNTTYTLTAATTGSPATNTNPAISLNGSDASTDTIQLVGSGATTVTRNSDGQITISSTDTNTNTTYTAGVGLTLNGTTFDANVSGTTQTVAANSVSATSSRTYAIQVDASDNLVVNVPWVDTNTNTDTLQTIANDTTSNDRYITFVNSATGAQTGGSSANLRYNPSSGVLDVGTAVEMANVATMQYNSTENSIDFIII